MRVARSHSSGRAMMRKERVSVVRRQALATVLVFTFASAYCIGILSPADGPGVVPDTVRVAVYPAHSPISIVGNEEFTAENGVVSGVGTADDPYLIEWWAFNMDDLPYTTCAVGIANTTAYFILRDLFIHGDDTSYARGVYLRNVTHGTVDACRITGLNTGLGVQSSSYVNITSNTLIGCDCAISGSENVSFKYNEGAHVAVEVGSCRNISVSYNEVNYSLLPDYPRGLTIRLSYSDQCTILGNTLWRVNETGDSYWASIYLDQSTNCTVDDNEMNAGGLSLDARTTEQFSTHMIGENNTVRMLPLRFYKDFEGMVIDRADFGQLIIWNCSDVRIRDLTAIGLLGPIRISSCSEVDVTDCVFMDTYRALNLRDCSEVRVRHNTFVNGSEVWAQYCDRLTFADNEFVSGTFGTLHAGGLSNSTIENNQFVQESYEVYISGSENLTIRNNQFSLMGLRIDGYTAREYDSHTIDLSNTVGGGKPVLYLKNEAGLSVDMSNYSQLIMGGCTGMDIHDMTTSASWAVQIGFSDEVTVHDCRIYGSHPIELFYADKITFFENDFVNPGMLMSLTMTHNVTTYHCNILGSYGAWGSGGFDNYTPTNIQWDNGYPDGGNYWEGWSAYDNYSGPAQDEPGSDGICDQPRSTPWGSDRYPLAAPYVHSQTVEPGNAWQDTALWLSVIACIVITSGVISYLLFVRERPRKPERVPPNNLEEP